MVNVGDSAALIQYVNSQAPAYGLDPAAVLAVAQQEGLNGGIGDSGQAYGPWQDWLTYFQGRPWYGGGTNNQQVQQWAWSTDGINYVLGQMQGVAKGLSGQAAVHAIVYGFERPQDPSTEVTNAMSAYGGYNNGTTVGTTGSIETTDPTLASSANLVSAQSDASVATTTATSATTKGQFTLVPAVNGPGFSWPGIKIGTGWLWSIGFFLAAGLLIITGLLVYFHKQVEEAAGAVGKAAVAAA